MQTNNTSSPSHLVSVAPEVSRFPWFLSLMLLVFVSVSSVGLFFYNLYLDSTIETLQEKIQVTENDIRTLSQDRQIIVAQILQGSAIRPSLDIKGLITEFRNAARLSNVRLKGFSVANDVISTTLIANVGDPQVHSDPAITIIKMMTDYAQGQKYFSLEPIMALSGDPKERTTAIQLKVVGKKY